MFIDKRRDVEDHSKAAYQGGFWREKINFNCEELASESVHGVPKISLLFHKIALPFLQERKFQNK